MPEHAAAVQVLDAAEAAMKGHAPQPDHPCCWICGHPGELSGWPLYSCGICDVTWAAWAADPTYRRWWRL